jgi:hypothetical protein
MIPPASDDTFSHSQEIENLQQIMRDTPRSISGSFTTLEDPVSALCSPEKEDYPFIFDSRPFPSSDDTFSQPTSISGSISGSFSGGGESARSSKEFNLSYTQAPAMSYQSYVVQGPEEDLSAFNGTTSGDFVTDYRYEAKNMPNTTSRYSI